MNLTSKRMLQFLSVCAGAFALTAAAQNFNVQNVWVSDNFEAEGDGYTNATPGLAAGMYKAYVWGGNMGTDYTNVAWGAGAGDASTIVGLAEGDSYGGALPITNTNARAQALKLETEGQTLTRYVAFENIDDGSTTEGIPRTRPKAIDFYDAPVYVDTLIKFTPSEDDPDPESTDPLIKVAVFVNANSNLVVRHLKFDGSNQIPTNSVIETLETGAGSVPLVINPEAWYRLTLKLENDGVQTGWSYIEIWLDGTKLTHANAALNATTFSGGSWFFSLRTSEGSFSQVSFQGTGYVDDLVIADGITPFSTTAGTTLTLVFNDNLLNVFDIDNVSVSSNATITSGDTLKIYTEDWYQINSITGDGITWTGDTPGELVTNVTGTISADVAGRTATINAGLYTGTIQTGLTGPYATVPADKVAAWAVANNLALANVLLNAGDYLDNYLMNVDVDVETGIEITSIVYDAAKEEAEITVEAVSTEVDFNAINGELVVWTTDNLGTAFGQAEEEKFSFTIDEFGEVVTFKVKATAGNFIRARVQ
jgi:hypothetical protein